MAEQTRLPAGALGWQGTSLFEVAGGSAPAPVALPPEYFRPKEAYTV